jgi:hypothetical protein
MTIHPDSLSRAARLLGRKGGEATAQKLSPEQRTANARQAVNARWARVRDAAPEQPDEEIVAMRETPASVNRKHAEFWKRREGMPGQ